MAGATPHTIWNTIRRARLLRVLAVYLGACLVALEVVDLFTQQPNPPGQQGCAGGRPLA